MMRRAPLVLLALIPLLWGFDPFRTSNTAVEEGNAKLGAGKYKEALDYYNKAAKDLPDSAGVHYNRGIALSRLSKLKEAKAALLKGTLAQDRALKARSFYNLGNVQIKLKKYKEAVDAYRRALRLNPDHLASKWNLEIALRLLQEKKKKEQQKKDQQKKDQQKKKQKKDQNKKDGKNQQQDKGQQKQQGDKQPKPKPKHQQKKKDPQQKRDQGKKQQPQRADKKRPRPKPSDKKMNSVLDALDRNDRNLQRRRARILGHGRRPPVKDW
jgi:tetratricopeptide (TPR) repeat protein